LVIKICYESGDIYHRFLFAYTNLHEPKNIQMNELVQRLVAEANLTPEQAQQAVETIANFVKEKFPMLGGAVDQIFSGNNFGE